MLFCPGEEGAGLRPFRKCALPLSLIAVLAGADPACGAASGLRRVVVAPDRWTFQEKFTCRPFVPYGTNYTPKWGGWVPDYFSEERWNEERVACDFDVMRDLGVNIVKLAFPARRILPDPQAPGEVRPDRGVLERFDRYLQIAGERGIRLIVTFELGWLRPPRWWYEGGGWYGPNPPAILSDFWRQLASRYRGDGRIFAYSFCVETSLWGWGGRQVLLAWKGYLRRRYGTLELLNRSWGTDYASWGEIAVPGDDGRNDEDWKDFEEGTPENENLTNDPRLYDFLLFREYVCFRYMYAQTVAVKSVDPAAMTSMGFVQWQPICRQLWRPVFEGPARGPEFNAKEMAKAFDFLGIHFYSVYPGGNRETQLRYLELWARYAHAGKPVVLEEFNGGSGERNADWFRAVIGRTRGCVSGWLVWTFQNVPGSDNITRVSGLFDEEGRKTPCGRAFREMGPTVKSWRLRRTPPSEVVRVDKRWIFTSGRYRDFLDGLLKKPRSDIDFSIETNPMIDWLKDTRRF